MNNTPVTRLDKGRQVIENFVRSLPDSPGVYRMIDEHDNILYVGKAKSLKKRVISYTRIVNLPNRLQLMVANTARMEITKTPTEGEALLLEANLIKKLKPRYNILLRDDKSFPYILLPEDHDFPQLVKHRGKKARKGAYFGPFASAGAVNRTLNILQRVFMIRNCSDAVFNQRTRPCLQYHIKRCTAPCVGYTNKDDYEAQIKDARDFLSGKSRDVQERFSRAMQKASAKMEYEKAAQYRDRLRALTTINMNQDVHLQGLQDGDIIALHRENNQCCVQVFFFRGGANFGNRPYFPRHSADDDEADILNAFIAQFYVHKPIPSQILLSHDVTDKPVLAQALSDQSQHKVTITVPKRGERRRVIDMAITNAKDALKRHLADKANDARNLEQVKDMFDLDEPPKRIEIYDNSHISGTNMVGAMVVAGPDGLQKNSYRKFNIKNTAQSDDYGMMREVIERRFKRALGTERGKCGPGTEQWPDLLLIDGGLGQFNAVREVLEDLGIFDDVTVVAIAKGEDRNAGRETFHMRDKPAFQRPLNDPALYYLQRLRDEAHRFAIGTHRAKRQKSMTGSPLDGIAGIGGTRKRELLNHFGSAKAVSQAGINDLEQVNGISRAMAEKIYNHFHEE